MSVHVCLFLCSVSVCSFLYVSVCVYLCVCMCVCVYVFVSLYVCPYVCAIYKVILYIEIQFSPSTMWVLGVKLRLLGLETPSLGGHLAQF